MSTEDDLQIFEEVLENLHRDFQRYPFHYGNENPVMPELHRQLRSALSPETVPFEYRQDHSNMDDWRNRELFDRVGQDEPRIPRVRPEVRFYRDGIWRGVKSDFDLVIFPADRPVVMQGKREGIGNLIDIDGTTLSVLCEIKHSMNMSGRFRSGGRTDIQALAEFPGEVAGRYFVFLDWWPRDAYGTRTFEGDRRGLEEALGSLDTPVDVVYVPRHGDLQIVRDIGQ